MEYSCVEGGGMERMLIGVLMAGGWMARGKAVLLVPSVEQLWYCVAGTGSADVIFEWAAIENSFRRSWPSFFGLWLGFLTDFLTERISENDLEFE